MLVWLSRCLPGFSIIALTATLVFAFSDLLKSALWKSLFPPSEGTPWEGPWKGLGIAQSVFVVYNIFVHTQMFAFTLRLGWSFTNMIKQTRHAIQRRPSDVPIAPIDHRDSVDTDYSLWSSSDISVAKPVTVAQGKFRTPELVHAIILPNYCEDLHTLETTLRVLASHPRAKTQYEVKSARMYVWNELLTFNRYILPWNRRRRTQLSRPHSWSLHSESTSWLYNRPFIPLECKERSQERVQMWHSPPERLWRLIV